MTALVDITGKSCDGTGSDYWDAGSVLVAYATRWPAACALPAGCIRFDPAIDVWGTAVEVFKFVDNLVSGQPASVGPNALSYSYGYNCGDPNAAPYLGNAKSFRCTRVQTDTGSWVIYDPAADEAGCDPSFWPTLNLGSIPWPAVQPLLRYVGPALSLSVFSLWQLASNGFGQEKTPVLYGSDGAVENNFELTSDDGYSHRQYTRSGSLTLAQGVYLSPVGICNTNDAYYAIEAAIGSSAFWTDFEGCKEVSA